MPGDGSRRGPLLPAAERFTALTTAAAALGGLTLIGLALVPAADYVRWLLTLTRTPFWVVGLPLAWVIFGVSYCSLCVALRWILLPRIPEGTFAASSGLVFRWGVVHRLTHLAQTIFVAQFTNTPWVNLWFRALGARIEEGVTLNSTDVTDWDLVSIGAGTMVGFRAGIQAHSGEGGAVRFTRVSLGPSSQVGRDAMLFDGVTLEEGAVVAPATLVPPGRRLVQGGLYCGVPARKASSPSGAPAPSGSDRGRGNAATVRAR